MVSVVRSSGLVNMQKEYTVGDLAPYINWPYFFHAWGFPARYASIAQVHDCLSCRQQWVGSFSVEEQPRAKEAVRLYESSLDMLRSLSIQKVRINGRFRLFRCHSNDDNIVLELNNGKPYILPMLRQQTSNAEGYCLCLADFVSEEKDFRDEIGVFCTSVDYSDSTGQDSSLLTQTLCDRLAEAGAERLHEEVRKRYWGYAPEESLQVNELLEGKYVGIRPAVGYPCLPDLSLNFLLDELLDFSEAGIRLTEHGMMIPHASVSGLMLQSSSAQYFSVGRISEEQLEDYARRRQLPVDIMRKYLC